MKLNSITPILRCSDLKRGIRFYTEILGFKVVGGNEGDYENVYAVLENGPIMIHLDAMPESQHDGPSAVFMSCDDVDATAEEIKKRGGKLDSEPMNEPYGMRDFNFKDPDGNILCIGAPMAGSDCR